MSKTLVIAEKPSRRPRPRVCASGLVLAVEGQDLPRGRRVRDHVGGRAPGRAGAMALLPFFVESCCSCRRLVQRLLVHFLRRHPRPPAAQGRRRLPPGAALRSRAPALQPPARPGDRQAGRGQGRSRWLKKWGARCDKLSWVETSSRSASSSRQHHKRIKSTNLLKTLNGGRRRRARRRLPDAELPTGARLRHQSPPSRWKQPLPERESEEQKKLQLPEAASDPTCRPQGHRPFREPH